jgi:hypothetical protein
MAALNFPPSPSTNQIYTANGKSWRFDGTSWKTYYILGVQGGGTGNTFYNLGDILVGAGTSLYPLPVGSNSFVLTADNSAAFGITWRSTAATGITTLNSLTNTSQYFSFGYSGDFPNISSLGSTHTFNIPIAGAGATGLVSTLSQTFAGQKTFTSAIIGDLIGTATTAGFATTASYAYQAGYGITAGFATTASYSYQSGYGITAGFATTASYSYQSGYGITSGFATTASYSYQSGYGFTSGFATTASYAYQSGYGFTAGFATTASYSYQSGYGFTAGFATTAANINVANAASNLAHPLIFGSTATGSGVAVSSNTTISFNPSTFILSTSGLAITAPTISTSSSTGALVVAGGVGIGGSLFLTSSLPSSLSGIVVNNGVITSGSWSGNTITAFYGGTGYNSYNKGDILVGAGNTFIKLNVGTDNYVLTASSLSSTGLTWSPTAATGLTTLNGLSTGVQYLAFGYSGTVPAFSSSGSTHTLNIPLAGTGSTGLISTQAQSFAGIKTFTNAVSITDNTGSGSYTSGALTVSGGVGIGGTLNVQGDLNVQGTFTTINSTTITVADKNIELGVVSTPTDLTAQGGGITLRGATDKSINWYSGVGWSSSESWNLASGNTFKINGTTVLSNSSLGTGVTNSSLTAVGTITTGTWSATAITALYGGTGLAPTFTVGDILYANTSTTWGRLTASSNSGFVLVSAGSGATPTYVNPNTLSVGFATTASYSHQSGYAITSGFATTAANLNVSNASTGTFYPVLSNTASTTSGIGASVNGFFSFNAATGAFGATSVNILSGQSYNVGGNSVLSATSLGTGVTNSSLTALGTIATGVWAGSLITAFYGGTGYNSYTKGDILVGAGNTFIKLNVGADNFVLTADNTTPTGVKWTSVAGLSITSVNGLTASAQFFSTGTSGTGFNISSSGSTHTFNIPIAGVGATGLVSTLAQSFAGVKTFTNDVIISSNTGSTAFNTGALTVYGGLGVSGQLSFNQAALGYTGAANPSMAFIGSTTAAPITLTVLSDNSLLWEGTSGKLFGINNNLSSGWIFNVGDISGLPIIRANADGTIAMAEFAANVGIGLSNPSYKLHVVGDTNLSSTYVYRINGTSVLSASSLGTGVTNSSLTAVGTLTTGVWAATAITAFYGGTGYNSYTKGDILVGAGSTFIKLNVGADNFVLTASSLSATGLTWSPTAATGLTTLNGLSAGVQFLAFGYSGTIPAFSSSGSTHTLNIPLAGSGSTGLISTQAQTIAGQKTFTSAIIGDLTGTATTAGFAATANYANQAGYAITSGFATTSSYSYQSGYAITSGLATTATNINVGNASSGTFYPVLSNTASSTSGIGASVNSLFSFNAANGAFGATSVNIFTGQSYSVGGNSVLSATSLGTGVTNSSLTALGTITTGTWSATAITAFYGGTGYQSYAIGDLLVGAGSTLYKLPVGSNNFVLTADNTVPGGIKWTATAATGVTTLNGLNVGIQYFSTGTSGSGFNISSSGSTHTFNIPIAGIASTGLVSTLAQSFAGVKTFTNDTVISSSTVSTSTSTGALTITGGVGIGGSLYTGTSTADSISGVVLNNGVITTGSWSATAVTARYGGTGNTSYTLGDLLVGAGSTFIKLPVGINSYVLGADSTKPSGIGWTTVTPLTVSDTPPASPKNADLWFNSLDGGLLVYYKDTDTSQWVEIALGSGIDLSQPVHITNTTPSTSTSTGALIVDGGVGIQGELHTSSLVVNGTYDVVGTSVTLSTTTADQVIYTLDASIYRSVKFMVQISRGSDFQAQEILLLHDAIDTYLTQYAQLLSGNDLVLATYDADLNSGNIRLLVTPTYTNTTFKIYGTAVRD